MPIFRVPKNANYTVMSNHHLRNPKLSLKAKGLLSYMLSKPDDWDYSLRGLASQNKDGVDSIRTALKELEAAGYLHREKLRDAHGHIVDYDYQVYEVPQGEAVSYQQPKTTKSPKLDFPKAATPYAAKPDLEKPAQPNTEKENMEEPNTHLSIEETRERFEEQLEYDILRRRHDPALLNELLEQIVEMYCCPKDQQYVGRQLQCTNTLRQRLDQLGSEHIEYVLDVLAENTRPIKNIRAYIRTMLLNAPTTMESYYLTQAQRLLKSHQSKYG